MLIKPIIIRSFLKEVFGVLLNFSFSFGFDKISNLLIVIFKEDLVSINKRLKLFQFPVLKFSSSFALPQLLPQMF